MAATDADYVSLGRLVDAMSAARVELRRVRQVLWNRSFMTTKEVAWFDRIADDGQPHGYAPPGAFAVLEVAVVAVTKNGHDVTAHVEVFISSTGWELNSYLGVLNDGEHVAWQGRLSSGGDLAGLHLDAVAAARETADAMIAFDFDGYQPSDIREH